MGALMEYNNFAFLALLSAAALAMCFSVCGMCICKIKNKLVTICFGCTLLPVAIAITVFGSILTGVSHSDEQDLQQFCLGDPNDDDGSDRQAWINDMRKGVNEVDTTLGGFVSETMCTHICPCDFDDIELQGEKDWLILFANEQKLAQYGRCSSGPDCEYEKELVLYKGLDTLKEIVEEMELFSIQAYTTFQFCFEDLKNGRRSKNQIP